MAVAYNPGIVTDGLVLYLDAANRKSYPGTGTGWSDLSGLGNNGILTNGATYQNNFNGMMTFDGTNDEVISTTISFTDYTFEIWARGLGDSLSGSVGFNTLVGYSGSKRLLYGMDGYLLAQVGSGGFFSTSLATRNQWNCIAFTYNSSNTTRTWYINGIPTGSTFGVNQGTWGSTLYIGSYNSNNYWMNGNIASVKLYNRAFSETEISQNFNALRGRFGI